MHQKYVIFLFCASMVGLFPISWYMFEFNYMKVVSEGRKMCRSIEVISSTHAIIYVFCDRRRCYNEYYLYLHVCIGGYKNGLHSHRFDQIIKF